jgi:uncharacterized membrane protein (UPF0127 family)
MRRLLVSLLVLGACSGADQPPLATSPSDPASATIPTSSDADATESSADATPAGTSTGTSITLDPNAVLPSGFELVAARVTEPDGTVCDLCLWLADSAEQRRRGLMFVTDLGPAAAMAFRYPNPHATKFHMTNTLLPLSIAFFDAGGAFMDSFDMEPCVTNDCRRYPTPRDFVIAAETYQGRLGEIGMSAGSTLELLELPCQP